MKIQLERNGEVIEVERIVITIGDTEYRIEETKPAYKEDGDLKINKNSYNGSSSFKITPLVSNDIIIG